MNFYHSHDNKPSRTKSKLENFNIFSNEKIAQLNLEKTQVICINMEMNKEKCKDRETKQTIHEIKNKRKEEEGKKKKIMIELPQDIKKRKRHYPICVNGKAFTPKPNYKKYTIGHMELK